MRVIGIDPGLDGAIAFYDGIELRVLEVPALKARGRGREVNFSRLWVDFFTIVKHPAWKLDSYHTFFEHNSVRPHEGVSSAFKNGYTTGALRMLVANRPVTLVTPGKWKKAMGLGPAKDASVARASELFPGYAGLFVGPRGGPKDGPAEAALIAYYGFNQLKGTEPDDF